MFPVLLSGYLHQAHSPSLASRPQIAPWSDKTQVPFTDLGDERRFSDSHTSSLLSILFSPGPFLSSPTWILQNNKLLPPFLFRSELRKLHTTDQQSIPYLQ